MNYSKAQLGWLVVLRVTIGWHFLYEGMVKLMNPNWSSVGFLLDSGGFFSSFFKGLANDPSTVGIIDHFNIWGLILIGLGLILGFLERPAIISAVILLTMYYLSHPPFVGIRYSVPNEGSYLIVNKNLIELIALVVLWVFPSSKYIGIDRIIFKRR